jgi:hypothetical protein
MLSFPMIRPQLPLPGLPRLPRASRGVSGGAPRGRSPQPSHSNPQLSLQKPLETPFFPLISPTNPVRTSLLTPFPAIHRCSSLMPNLPYLLCFNIDPHSAPVTPLFLTLSPKPPEGEGTPYNIHPLESACSPGIDPQAKTEVVRNLASYPETAQASTYEPWVWSLPFSSMATPAIQDRLSTAVDARKLLC